MRRKYVCLASTCRRETEIEIEVPLNGTTEKLSNPNCTCGSKMKIFYSKPFLLKLSKGEVIRRFR